MSATILYNSTVKQIHQLHQELERLENGQDTSSALQGQITAGLASLQRSANDLDQFARREVTAAKREKALARAKKVREDFTSIQIAFSQWKANERARASTKEREELLGSAERRTSSAVRHEPGSADTSILMMDQMLRENQVLEGSGHRIDEFIHMGRTALQDLYEQREVLKGTQRRLYDIANTLGLSTTVIRYIEQRTATDRWILLGGMTITIILMWGIVHYLG
ncbi:uncharacterized protein SPPG_07567 [Spizellomyces punctatus DAOM BR117]|uniref:Protein transport protein BOS1 n=1 Tax=Spizellomyces punctatus (strain DAOM BR117) TaxID=645134 RepID=A0A0L0H6Q4_SPIPD|nr:uncharacterized protein SPPG_07567 [Spizellomyces punctatus DAOM BR117]KNC97180.1 hypothetical protein SPPG_07567 [Spizellomyces punctatus DAOM BR117]|eukprot:XP_016605220.1 hypothetical protein SPPG_07567 [Spizellomyces punctatus DAOM BR117]